MLIQTVVSTFIILFTGEFIPKTLFKINPNLVLRILAFPVFVCYVILYPISLLASFLSYVLLRLLGVKVNSEVSKRAFTKVDLDYFVQTGIEHSESKEAIEKLAAYHLNLYEKLCLDILCHLKIQFLYHP